MFKDHHDRKTLTQFFPPLYEEYFALWPPVPTAEFVQGEGKNMENAVVVIRKEEEQVRYLNGMNRLHSNVDSSECIDGCTIEPDRSMV